MVALCNINVISFSSKIGLTLKTNKLIPTGMLCNRSQHFPAKKKKREKCLSNKKEVLILSCESGYLLTSL